jgi:hypothetical protein
MKGQVTLVKVFTEEADSQRGTPQHRAFPKQFTVISLLKDSLMLRNPPTNHRAHLEHSFIKYFF